MKKIFSVVVTEYANKRGFQVVMTYDDGTTDEDIFRTVPAIILSMLSDMERTSVVDDADENTVYTYFAKA
ncbi:MAG: hypothetical protein MJ168_08120 [Clostridia bacterium]|nr:hypothetical protein [Clostridia bacterium]